jgi:hypothetical protein
MAITEEVKEQFINGMVLDMLKDIKDPSEDVVEGMKKYATGMYNRISTLIKSASLLDQAGQPLPYTVV